MNLIINIIGIIIIVLITIIYALSIVKISKNYAKSYFSKYLGIINFGIVILYLIFFFLFSLYDYNLKQDFLTTNNWIYPTLFFMCIVSIYIVNKYVKENMGN